RANAVFTLYRLFNNIYVNTAPTSPENAFDIPQDKSSEEEIFSLLRADLDFAIANLEYQSPQIGRWTKGGARHLRAKVAMWEKDWEEAASQADSLINNSNHSLVGSTAEVFAGDLNHSETLFALNFQRETIGGGEPHIMSWNVVANYSLAPGLLPSIENGGSGAGFLTLNNYMIDLLEEDPNDERRNTYYIFDYKYNDEEMLPAGKKIGEPLDLYENDSSDQNAFMLYYIRQNPGVRKFMDETAEPTDRNHYKNIMIYRLAETYLIGAEAHMMLGNTSTALDYINAVRERANTEPIDEIDLQAILDEHARELGFEGQRWY